MIQHVALETREDDVGACVAFYALLGFGRVEPPETLAGRVVWLQRRGQQLHLLLTDDPVVPPQGHVALVADDYEADLTRLRAAGHEPEPRAAHWGSARCFVDDPAGHRVELMAFPPLREPGL